MRQGCFFPLDTQRTDFDLDVQFASSFVHCFRRFRGLPDHDLKLKLQG